MPDQVELRVLVNTDGGSKLDALVQSVQNIEKSLASAGPQLKNLENGVHGAGNAAESNAEKIKAFGESIRQHIETPIGSASLSLGRFAESLGTTGVAVAATAGVFATLGTMAFESAKKLGELGTEIGNISIRTGLSTEEVGRFSFAAKAAGSDITSLEGGMRMLSRALSDNSEEGKKAKEALRGVGIASTDMFGQASPTSDLLLEMSDAMSKMSTMAERNTFAMNVMGRAGLELVPMLLHLRENLGAASGVEVFSDAQQKEMEDMHKRVLLAEDSWMHLWHTMVEHPLASAFVGVTESFESAFTAHTPGSQTYDPTGRLRSGLLSDKGLALPGFAVNNSMDAAYMAAPFASSFAAGQKRIAGADAAYATDGKTGLEAQVKLASKDYQDALQALDAFKGQDVVDEVIKPLADAAALAKKNFDAATASLENFNKAQEEAVRIAQANKTYAERLDEPDTSGLTGSAKLEADRRNARNKAAAQGVAPELIAYQGARDDRDVAAEKDKEDKKRSLDDMSASERSAEALQKMVEGMADDRKKKVERDTELELKSNREDRNIDLQDTISTQTRAFRRAGAMAQLSAGPGNEGMAISAAYQNRMGLALSTASASYANAQANHDDPNNLTQDADARERELKKATHEITMKYHEEEFEAEEEQRQKIAELQMKSLDDFRSAAGSIFDAMTSKDPGTAMKNFFVGKAKDLGRGVFENMAEPVFHSMGDGASPIIPGQIGGNGQLTGLGGLLKGTWAATGVQASLAGGPGGGAVPANTTALGAATAATRALTIALGKVGLGGGGGGGVGSGGGGGGASPADGTYSGSDYVNNTPESMAFFTGAATPDGSMDSLNSMSSFSSSASAALSNPFSAANAMAQIKTIAQAGGGAFGSGSNIGQFAQGLASIPSGKGIEALTRTGDYASGGSQGDDTAKQIGAGVGLAGATYAGVTQAMRDFSKGGGQGITAGIGAVAGTIANFDPEPISHMVLQSIAAVSTIVSSLFGDPKAERQASMNHELQNAAFNSTGYIDQHGNFVPGSQAKAISYEGSSTGESFDYNFQGGIRGGSFAGTTRNTYDPSNAANQLRNGYTPPPGGTPIDRAIGYGNQSGAGGPIQRPGTTGGRVNEPSQAMVIHVTTMDSKSFQDNAPAIASAMQKAIQMGHPVVQEMQQAVHPR